MLIPLAEGVLLPAAFAEAPHQRFQIDIPSGELRTSLGALAVATGVSLGFAGDLPSVRTAHVHGVMTIDKALSKLLAGSELRAVRLGPQAFRIERRPAEKPQKAPRTATSRPSWETVSRQASMSADIVVTGQKREQDLLSVPASISVANLDRSSPRIAMGASEIANSLEGLALTNLGPGRNRQFIRGVADSPFNGPSQSTVAVQIDESRVTFDAPDPDLRLVDVERVELLKGPQGPLYGSGALGGIYHIVTHKPDLAKSEGMARFLTEAVQHGGLGGGGEAVLNLPLAKDRLALRAVGYVVRGGGWIDNIGRNDNANSSKTDGGRLALRWQPSDDWTVDLAGLLQNIDVTDSQYVTGSGNQLRRPAPAVPETSDNDLRSVSGTVSGRIGSLRLLSATSYVDHQIGSVSDASASAGQFGLTGQASFHDQRAYQVVNQELRLSPIAGGKWVAGFSWLSARTRSEATLESAAGMSLPVEILNRKVDEYALFGEATVAIADHLSGTAGVRLSKTIAEDEAREGSGGSADHIDRTTLSPSLALSWAVAGRGIVYVRHARAVRPGGLAPEGQGSGREFASDQLESTEIGVRHGLPDDPLSLVASAYYTDWRHIQSDYLLPNGLVSTRNVGDGQIFGMEASMDWRIRPRFSLSGGLSAQNGRLVRTQDGFKVDDRRLPVVPDLSARLAIRQEFDLGAWKSDLTAQANYIGHARLSFDQSLDREMGGYATVSTAATLRRGPITLAARIDNLLDTKGDSFAFGNPFSIMNGRQFTPLKPRTITLSAGFAW